MADCRFITEYPPLVRHRAELKAARRARWIRLAIALPLAGLMAYWAFSLSAQFGLFVAAVSAGVLFFLWLPGGSSVDPGALAGVEGEVNALERLKRLPDEFTLFNRVKLPDGQLPNGWRELDFVVVGPTGLWVVEVKNTPGHVYVQPGERHWPLARRGCCGSQPNWNAVQNPIPQARAQVESLKRWLLQNGIASKPKPVICLAHAEVAVDNADASPVPVLVRDQLAEWISSGLEHDSRTPTGDQPADVLLETLTRLLPAGSPALDRAA